MLTRFKKYIEGLFSSPLPPVLLRKVNSYYKLGIAFIVVGIVMGLIWKSISIIAFPAMCGLILLLLGLTFMISIRTSGYNVVQGKCIATEDGLFDIKIGKRNIKYLIVDTGQERIRVNAEKRKQIDDYTLADVTLYISKLTDRYNSGEYTVYTSIFGYDIRPNTATTE